MNRRVAVVLGLAVLGASCAVSPSSEPDVEAKSPEDATLPERFAATPDLKKWQFIRELGRRVNPHLRELGGGFDPNHVAFLRDVGTTFVPRNKDGRVQSQVRAAAATALAAQRNDSRPSVTAAAVEACVAIACEQWNRTSDDTVVRYSLDALGALGTASGIAFLREHVRLDNLSWAAMAMQSLTRLYDQESVDSIITVWEQADRRAQAPYGTDRELDRWFTIRSAASDALLTLTGEMYDTSAEYRAWWNARRTMSQPVDPSDNGK